MPRGPLTLSLRDAVATLAASVHALEKVVLEKGSSSTAAADENGAEEQSTLVEEEPSNTSEQSENDDGMATVEQPEDAEPSSAGDGNSKATGTVGNYFFFLVRLKLMIGK